MKENNNTLANVGDKIITLRNQQVILDCDVAELYGVQTKEVNQAVKNNPEKFPEGYIIYVSSNEKEEVVKNFDHLKKLKFSPMIPKAFSEKGLYMLATILKSPKAVETTLAIVETFAKLRELARTVEQLSNCDDKHEQASLINQSGELLDDIITRTVTRQTVETSFEINMAMVKLKRLVRKEEEQMS